MHKQYFATRKTVRNFDHSKPLSESQITDLLQLAMQAPNTGNIQLYSVIVTTDPERIAALAPAHFSQPASTGAQAMLTFCVDMHRYAKWCRVNHTEPGLDNLQGFIWATMDAAIFAQQFVTLAELDGLGTCYLGTTTYNPQKIADLLKLPKGVVPVITVAVGHPAGSAPISERLPLSAIMHPEEYHSPTDDEIREIFREKESLESNRSFVAENGKENLAQVFAEVRYPKALSEQFSKIYADFIAANGIEL